MNAIPDNFVTLEDYFRLEETGENKHEYFHGAIYDMTGASYTHTTLVHNIDGQLYVQLRGKSCRAHTNDLRVKIETTMLYTYPDLLVICGQPQFADGRNDTVTNPTLIIEVLSPSTEGYDRGKKFQHYRTIDTLREYLLVAQDAVRAERYVRQSANEWLLQEFTALDQMVSLESIGCALPLAAVYEDVTFEEGT
jgi:Uma2 family endonuclease